MFQDEKAAVPLGARMRWVSGGFGGDVSGFA